MQGTWTRVPARLVAGMMVAVLLLLANAARAQHVPEDPILRLATDMHIAPIVRIDSDAAGRTILTASDDRTARLWDAATGELLQILRVPLGSGRDGMLYAGALSPDGRIAVLGGWTDYGGRGSNLFVMEVSSGRMLRRIGGIGNTVADLEFSPDGRFLAVAMGGTAGVLVLETAGWTRRAELGGYGGSAYALSWAGDGRLASAAYDGTVRLYAPDFRQLALAVPGGGTQAHELAFSPDGSRIAVGFADSPVLQVLDAASLQVLYEPDNPQQRDFENTASVAWAEDGARLVAAGSSRLWDGHNWRSLVRIWDEGGRGGFRDIPAAGNTIMDIRILPGGEVALGGSQPDLTVVSLSGGVVWHVGPDTLDMTLIDRSHLRLRGDALAAGLTPAGPNGPLRFDLIQRLLRQGQAPYPPALTSATGLVLTNWRDSWEPLLNGVPLDVLETYEASRSVAVAADGSLAVIGADWSLQAIGVDGGRRWRIPVPSETWAVNLAQDSPLVLAAYGDGTLRWHRAADGAELLALFIEPDHETWIAWTPSGYYDAAPGGEELLGWHVNRGLDAEPVFFPAALFRDRFYRPDVVQQILLTLDEADALARADTARAGPPPVPRAPLAEVLPPVIRIRAPERDAGINGDTVTLDLEVTTAGDAPLIDLRARVNGRAVVPDPVVADNQVTLALPALEDSELYLTLLGANRHGFGEPAEVRLRRDSQGPQPFELRPKLYVLSVGVSAYEDPELNLNYAAKDAEDVAALFATQAGPMYREVEVQLITDADATFRGVRNGLGWLRREMTDLDTAVIFVAGHGLNDNNGDLYFLTHEADPDALFETAVEATQFTDTIQRLPGRVIYFMDTCHSGNLEFVRRGARVLDLNGHLQDLRAATGAVVFSSATGSQYALESPDWGNGAFTLALLDGLRGAADFDGDGAVSINEIALYTTDMVKRLTGNQQTPTLLKPGAIQDFPLALLR